MHLVAQEDEVPVAEILVKYNAAIDPQTKAGYTPLHTACHFGKINMIRFLLERGANVDATTKAGYTPLHQAAQQGHVLVISLLLKHNANPDVISNVRSLHAKKKKGLQTIFLTRPLVLIFAGRTDAAVDRAAPRLHLSGRDSQRSDQRACGSQRAG